MVSELDTMRTATCADAVNPLLVATTVIVQAPVGVVLASPYATEYVPAVRVGVSAMMVPVGRLVVLRTEDKLGHRAASTAALAFEDCRVRRLRRYAPAQHFRLRLALIRVARNGR